MSFPPMPYLMPTYFSVYKIILHFMDILLVESENNSETKFFTQKMF